MHFQTARKRARELDAHWRTHRLPIGPLHGLPVSLMDRFHVAGLDTACGFASWVGSKRTADDEGGVVKSLQSLGAVIFCKTNVPMSMMVALSSPSRFCYLTDGATTDGRNDKQHYRMHSNSVQPQSFGWWCLWWYFVMPSLLYKAISRLTLSR